MPVSRASCAPGWMMPMEQPIPSELFGDFEIERREDGSLWELGRGAMGITYRASDNVLHRAVALKVIEPPGRGERFAGGA